MSNPLITVILPCYNAENFIYDALQSVINQSYKNLEILLIDDGSTDSSISKISSLIEMDNRINIITNEVNLGLIKTLNKGVSLAKGNFIARMDADDLSENTRIEKQLKVFLEDVTIDILGTKASPIDIKGNPIPNESCTYLEAETLKTSALFTQPFFHGSVMAKAEVLKKNSYSESFKHSEDFELWNRLSAKNYKLANLNEPLYLYRQNPNGVSVKFEANQIQSHNLASKKYIEELLDITMDKDVIAVLNNRPSGTIDIGLIKKAFRYFELIFNKNRTDSTELENYRARQTINILIQCIKKANSVIVSGYCFGKIVSGLLNKTTRNYVVQRIKKSL
jgi:glycosyltransferase involved in cell wall biosynthesis